MRLYAARHLAERALVVTERNVPVLDDTRRAFDAVASSYHQTNVTNGTLCEMRCRALSALLGSVPAGSRVLDLGCGPGTDQGALVEAGYTVTAVDWSPGMVAEAKRRAAATDGRVEVYRLGVHEIDQLEAGGFDAVYSNFGALNCVPSLASAAQAIARRLRPGGALVATLIGRFCPWEIALCLARGEWRRMRVRFAPAFVAVPLNGAVVWTRYYAPGHFERACAAAGFQRVSVRALALFVPPPYLDGFAVRHPSLIGRLWRLEDRVAHLPGIRAWGDHFLVVMRKGEAAGQERDGWAAGRLGDR